MLLAYHAYARRPSLLRYIGVFVLLLLGLLSKPMVVTAPFVLLLLDFWPLRRWQLMPQERSIGLQIYSGESDEPDVEIEEPDCVAISETPQLPRRTVLQLIVEKLPLLTLSLVFSTITFRVQQASGAMGMLGPHWTWYMRLGNAITSYGNYLSKTVFPSPLAAIYPNTPASQLVNSLILATALIALTVASLRMARERPYLIVGVLWFLGTLVPVIGLVQIGNQTMADRYTYIPLIGVFIAIAWGGAEFVEPWSAGQRAASALFMLAVFSVATYLQVGYWRNSETLFRHAASLPYNYVAHDYLANALAEQDNLNEAIDEYTLASKLRAEPTFRKLGLVLEMRGRYADSRAAFLEAIKIQSNQPQPYRHLAWLMATAVVPSARDGNRAIALAQHAIDLDKSGDPVNASLNCDTLAAAYAEAGRLLPFSP